MILGWCLALSLLACDELQDSPASVDKTPVRQSFVVTVQQDGVADFRVLASIPESWSRKPVAQGLSQAFFAARGSCGPLDQDVPDHAIVVKDGKVVDVQTDVGAAPSCFGATLVGKTLLSAGQGFTGAIYLRTRIHK
ncbi:MAG TPA: hypothetical protein ENK23_02675 [Sorangium sp.]|nr:hypothetical protein [Sorangium sp.]